MAENNAKHMSTSSLAVCVDVGSTGSKVDLSFLARCFLNSPEGKHTALAMLLDVSIHAPVTTSEAIVTDQILIDALRCKLLFDTSRYRLMKSCARTARVNTGDGFRGKLSRWRRGPF